MNENDSPKVIELPGQWYTDTRDDSPAWRTFHEGWASNPDGPACSRFCILAADHPGPHMASPLLEETFRIGPDPLDLMVEISDLKDALREIAARALAAAPVTEPERQAAEMVARALPWKRGHHILEPVEQHDWVAAGAPPLPEETRPKAEWQIEWCLLCPECGDSCVEQGAGGGADHTAVEVHPDRDAYDSPIGTRGGFVRVKLFCPSGHGFDLIIANHKGSEAIAVVPAGLRDYASDGIDQFDA